MSNSYVVSIRLEGPPEDEDDLARDPGTKEGPLIDIVRKAVEGEGLTVEDSGYLPGPKVFPPHFLIGVEIKGDINTERLKNIVQEQWNIKAQEFNDPYIPVDITVQDLDD
ncbi:hypothetical protein BDV41DRAFT_527206 [Aspergillus transmontanensis]|uniref:Uncharacterized protein n=1 Tax=Aspergillus transmontanensis TaxID=1034304 RepID=A0A5N6W8K8_9EURO|nr:hypothetical protein BDV41DRAFT_527206 [Aspergillus transmontanensis]